MKLLCCIDFSEVTMAVLQETVKLAKITNGEIYLLHIRTTSSSTSSHASQASASRIGDEMVEENNKFEKAEEFMRDSSVKFISKIVKGSVDGVIIAEAKEFNADYIIMGALENNALHHMVSGSVPAKVLRKSKIPMLLVPEYK